MELIDLTHIFTDHMPTYPGDPCPRLYETCHARRDGFGDSKIESTMHVGTHMDAPLHMLEEGAYISDFPLNLFQGRGRLVDARDFEIIDERLIENSDIREDDIVLVYTGWDKKYRSPEYYKNWPIMSEGFAKALVERNISLIGMDTPSPDADEPFAVHKIFLPNNVLIIENLTGLEHLQGKTDFKIHAYPIKYKADAAPVRVIAELSC